MSCRLSFPAVLFGVAVVALAASGSAQTVSGGRQGAHGGGHGYSYTASGGRGAATVSVQTNAGRGLTASHTGGVNSRGVYSGTSSVTTNNGSSLTTQATAKNGYVSGAATATGANGQTATASGAVYIPK